MALLDTTIAFGIRLPPQAARWAPIPVRLIVGVGFLRHGLAKLSRGPDAFATILQALGVPAPHVMAWVTILIEVLGGLAVLAGAFVALVGLPMAALLVVAMFTVHRGMKRISCNLACLAALVLGSSGPLAIDDIRGRRSTARL